MALIRCNKKTAEGQFSVTTASIGTSTPYAVPNNAKGIIVSLTNNEPATSAKDFIKLNGTTNANHFYHGTGTGYNLFTYEFDNVPAGSSINSTLGIHFCTITTIE